MKTIVLILTTAFFFSYASAQKIEQASNPQGYDKEFIKNYFDETYQGILDATKGLTDEQLNFKASPEKWSILECLEHIVITEPMLFGFEKEALSKPATPERRSELKLKDSDIKSVVIDRSHKAKAPAEMSPSGKYKDVQSALNDLQEHRKLILSYLEDYSMDDLRNHILEGPLGAIDAYQFMLFIPGHAARHTLQMQEVKLDPNFPG
ncbi:DinB family protein [Sinomicrobium sp.]